MGIRFNDDQGLTIIEALITFCIIGILMGVMLPKYQSAVHEAREIALKMGLANIRTSIRLFRVLNERNPGNLRELIEKDVLFPARSETDSSSGSLFFNEKYLLPQALDAEGYLIDAFGNRYAYDPVRGEVKAATKGYERW